MRAKRKVFTPEFKIEAVRLANESEKPLSQVARELAPTCCAAGDGKQRAERVWCPEMSFRARASSATRRKRCADFGVSWSG